MSSFKSNANPMFRSRFSEDIFNLKYSHPGADTWEELAHTLVEDVCGDLRSGERDLITKDEKAQLKKYIRDLKFVPGGRYLYYAGRKNRYYNNCLSYSSLVMTDKGFRQVGSLADSGEDFKVLSPVDGQFYPATAKCYGTQQLNLVTFAPLRGRSKIRWSVLATANHRWPLMSGEVTDNLQVKDVVPANGFGYAEDDLGFAHGFVFGDGNRHGQLRLCCDKDMKHLPRLSKLARTVSYPESADGDPVLYFSNDIEWKKLPTEGASPEYVSGFIRGWIAADGCATGHVINSVNKEHLEWFRGYAPYAGLIITGNLRSQTRDVMIGEYAYKDHTIYVQNFCEGSDFSGFKVASIQAIGTDDTPVYCIEEPVHTLFVTDYGIQTGNCFLLKAEEDTREDWANLSWKSESCLMTGGGIGVDYSVYRQSGRILQGTGGVASGPIPKMEMINEIGRRVMQGGSRRSAIYASLNWDHGDVNDFLTAKDWDQMPVGNTGLTLKQIKEQDFNFPAPLDMTNISVNYNTDWLLKFWETGDVGEVFKQNVRQALRTAEPGFSFNFFEDESDTLRNACTEVVSSDDSDVCNLGSINLGRIESVKEFSDIVELATKFLICGTLRADLPYAKVYETREKNRRLGLGIMGLHEWLIQRESSYEVTPELHRWLSIYKGVSDKVSKEFADSLSVSRPVANRAIAPTGSIGILAGTTTGVEPLFAVAYKRRYLTNGTKWKYQYVVDSAAQELIDIYGADPENIESALDLADNYEQRIKFQADVQDYVDMSISSTINLPPWGSKLNNEDTVDKFANTLAKYAHRLRGFTCYPDGARGGQPLTVVPYAEAVDKLGTEFEEHVETHDICDISQTGGSCGV